MVPWCCLGRSVMVVFPRLVADGGRSAPKSRKTLAEAFGLHDGDRTRGHGGAAGVPNCLSSDCSRCCLTRMPRSGGRTRACVRPLRLITLLTYLHIARRFAWWRLMSWIGVILATASFYLPRRPSGDRPQPCWSVSVAVLPLCLVPAARALFRARSRGAREASSRSTSRPRSRSHTGGPLLQPR